jgi:hypothetical protein
MKKLSIISLTMIALSGFMVTSVWAQNPHFLRCSSSSPDNSGDVSACFRIAGLGGDTVNVTATANATAVYACLNHGDHCPSAANKSTTTAQVQANGTFTVTNGQAKGCLALSPPPSTLTCPNGQKFVLVSISYSDITLSAEGSTCTTAGGSANFFPNCP